MIEGVKISELKVISDKRGKIMHMMRTDSPVFKKFGEIYFSTIYKNIISEDRNDINIIIRPLKKMIENIMKLSNRYFLITTPYRFFPIDFHTKLPFLHMLPKSVHRKILFIIGLKEYAKEENLNLLDYSLLNVIF